MSARQHNSGQRGRRPFGGRGVEQQYDQEVLDVARVVRVVKGGRRFSFRASVVAGDRSGKVGFGLGKSRDVQTAIQKAYNQAVKAMITVVLTEGTLPHSVVAKFKGAQIQLRPARPGTGIIAGGTVRVIADMAGITSLVSKQIGSSNKVSNARAALRALAKVRS
jgi:small subunit ribosomal protein S5